MWLFCFQTTLRVWWRVIWWGTSAFEQGKWWFSLFVSLPKPGGKLASRAVKRMDSAALEGTMKDMIWGEPLGGPVRCWLGPRPQHVPPRHSLWKLAALSEEQLWHSSDFHLLPTHPHLVTVVETGMEVIPYLQLAALGKCPACLLGGKSSFLNVSQQTMQGKRRREKRKSVCCESERGFLPRLWDYSEGGVRLQSVAAISRPTFHQATSMRYWSSQAQEHSRIFISSFQDRRVCNKTWSVW